MMKLKSPLGYALITVAVAFSLLPETRKAARQLAVKGTEVILDLVDQAKSSTSMLSKFVQDPSTKPRQE
ncbi:hypothetical protein [Paenibacillus periandrae]|uniref:hypothetical protein n=1 Tax=Paenibacillus periandrae TaxID=1761741 RepID=UPI001F097CA0|nr:hypothetical protein [Paenibacillus periandrae]